MPGLNLLGGVGIILGLFFILYDNKKQASLLVAQKSTVEGMGQGLLEDGSGARHVAT